MVTCMRGGWSWKTSTPSICMKLSWWLAHTAEVWMGQQYIFKLTLSVSIIIWSKCLWVSHSRCVTKMCSSPLRWACCCDDCNCDLCWTVIDPYPHGHDLFLQSQMVRSLSHCQLWSCGVIYSQNSLFLKHLTMFMTFLSRLKRHFWPVVPDPANSSIKRWTSESTQVLKNAFVQKNTFFLWLVCLTCNV